jgi:hypothetical protein
MRIRIEMSFELLTSKWMILQKTMNCSNEKNNQIIRECAKLHNFCIWMKQLDDDFGIDQFVGDSPPENDLCNYGINFIGRNNTGSIKFDYLTTCPDDDPVSVRPWFC